MRWGVLVCLVLAVAAGARADVPRGEADRLAREGKALGDAGNNAEAIVRFKAADALVPNAAYDWNIGLAYARMERWSHALLYIERYRTRANAPLPAFVEQRHKRTVEQARAAGYAEVRLVSDPAGARVTISTLGADEPLIAPRTIWLPPGSAEVIAESPGLAPRRENLVVERGKPMTVELALRATVAEPRPEPQPEPKVTPPPPKVTPPPIVTPETPPAREPAVHRSSRALQLGLGIGIPLGVLAVGAAVAAALLARPTDLYEQGLDQCLAPCIGVDFR
jgi:hypothetical protein